MTRFALPLCLAALAFAAPAFAQSGAQGSNLAPRNDDVRVRIGDLDLASAGGAARFDERVERRARSACAGRPTIAGMQCREALTRELRDALPAQQRQDYARGRSGRVLAMVPNFSA